MGLTLLQWGWVIGGIFAILGVLESVRIMALHVKHFYQPSVQIFAVRIVAMVPVILNRSVQIKRVGLCCRFLSVFDYPRKGILFQFSTRLVCTNFFEKFF